MSEEKTPESHGSEQGYFFNPFNVENQQSNHAGASDPKADTNAHASYQPYTGQNYGNTNYGSYNPSDYSNPYGYNPYYGNTNGYSGNGYGGNYGGYYGQPYPNPAPKKRHMWSTAFLVITAVLALLIGGVVGAGITSVALGGDSNASSGQSQVEPNQNGSSGDSQGSGGESQGNNGYFNVPNGSTEGNSDIEQGTKVDSAPGMVVINSFLLNGTSAGTGFVIDADQGIVLTNYHVVEDTETVVVTVADSGTQYQATVLGHDATKDIAVLQIKDATDLTAVSVSDSQVSVGDKVSVLGNSEGEGYISKLEGTVTATDQTITARDSASSTESETLTGLIETDADVVSGYSGGVMLNSDGKVVGITVAASGGTTSDTVYGYAIPIETGVAVAKQVLTGESSGTVIVGRSAALGITVTDTPSTSGTTGATISGVIQGSAAEDAGLQAGDIITAVDGKQVEGASELSELIRSHSIGDKVTLSITRGTKTMDVTVTLKESSFN